MDQPLGENETFVHSETLFAPLGKPMVFSMPASKEEKHINAKKRIRAWVLHGGGKMAETGKDVIRLGLPGEAPAGDVDPLFVKASVDDNRLQDLKFYTMPPVVVEKPTPPSSKFNVAPRNPIVQSPGGVAGRVYFTADEDQLIAAYYREHGAGAGFGPSSKIFWQRAAKEECFKNRSFESLRTRFIQHVRKRMEVGTYVPAHGASTKAASVATKSVSTSSSSPPLRGVSASQLSSGTAPPPPKQAKRVSSGSEGTDGEDSAAASSGCPAAKRKRSSSLAPSPAKRSAGGKLTASSTEHTGTGGGSTAMDVPAEQQRSPATGRSPIRRPSTASASGAPPADATVTDSPSRQRPNAPKLIVSEASEDGGSCDTAVTMKRSKRLVRSAPFISTEDDSSSGGATSTGQRRGRSQSSKSPAQASAKETGTRAGSDALPGCAAAKRRLRFASSSKSPELRRETRASTGKSPLGSKDSGNEVRAGLSGLSASVSSRRGLTSGSEGSDDVDKDLYQAASRRQSLRSKNASDPDTGKSIRHAAASAVAAKAAKVTTSTAKAATSAPARYGRMARSNGGVAHDNSDLQSLLDGCSAANLPQLGGELRSAFQLHLQVLKLAVDGHQSYVEALGLLHECSGQYDEALAIARSETPSEGCHLWSPDEDAILQGPDSKGKRELISVLSKKACDLRLRYLSA